MPPASPDPRRSRLQAAYLEALAPVTERMFASATLGAGQRVLDVGSGAGDTALRAAAAVGPSGHVVASDISHEALQGLIERIRATPHAAPIAVVVAAVEDLALETGSFDVALARNCVMYCHDLPRACANVHAGLRAGGRFVASVYGPIEREPFHAIPVHVVGRRCELREPYPEYVQAFRVGAAELEVALRAAGFSRIERHVVPVARSFPSAAEAAKALRLSHSLGELMSRLPPPELEAAWSEIEDGFRAHESSGRLHLPGEQVVVVAVK